MIIINLPTVKKMNLDPITKGFLANKDVVSEIENLRRLLDAEKFELFETEKASLLKNADENGALPSVIEDVLNKIGIKIKGKRGRKPKVAPANEAIYDDFAKEEAKEENVVVVPKRKRPQVAPAVAPAAEAPKKRGRKPKVAPVVAAVAEVPKRKRPQVAPQIPIAQPVQVAVEAPKKRGRKPKVAPVADTVVLGKSKEVKAIRRPATESDLKVISKRVVKAVEGSPVGNAVYEAKRKGEVVDVKRVLEEVYTNKGKTGYSLVDATNFLKGGAARKREEKE